METESEDRERRIDKVSTLVVERMVMPRKTEKVGKRMSAGVGT